MVRGCYATGQHAVELCPGPAATHTRERADDRKLLFSTKHGAPRAVELCDNIAILRKLPDNLMSTMGFISTTKTCTQKRSGLDVND